MNLLFCLFYIGSEATAEGHVNSPSNVPTIQVIFGYKLKITWNQNYLNRPIYLIIIDMQ